jgi:hypothetical protein
MPDMTYEGMEVPSREARCSDLDQFEKALRAAETMPTPEGQGTASGTAHKKGL